MVEQTKSKQRCAIYTRKSSEEGLDQEFNSLHAQRESCEAYIHSQKHEGWRLIRTNYDDGGFSGGNIERPALQQLKQDIAGGLIDVVLVYKVDRLSRSLANFVQLIEFFDRYKVSFAAVTQQFNTSTSMGRLTLNVLLSFAQFEREVTGERIRDKIAASKQKGMWMGGRVPLGYDVVARKLIANEQEADVVRHIYSRYIALKNVKTLKAELDQQGYTTKPRSGASMIKFSRGALYNLLKNPIYIGQITHKGRCYAGEHKGILELVLWEEAQQLLRHNAQTHRVRGAHTSLLSGVLFDDAGNPMSPTHSKKGAKRYRYYISQALLQFREDEAGSVQRVPAQSIEECVGEQIKSLLRDKHRLLDFLKLGGVDAPVISAALSTGSQLASRWERSTQQEKATWIRQWFERIELSRSKMCMLLSVDSLRDAILKKKLPKTQYVEIIEVDVALKRCGLEARLIVEGIETTASADSVSSLQQALLSGLKWSHALRTGRYRSFQEIAIDEKVTRGYVRRLSRLAYLSPELMDTIIAGNVSQSLTLENLKVGFPLDWSEQKRIFS